MGRLSPDFVRTLASKRADVAPAVVWGLGANGLSYLRCLGRRDIPVLALDLFPRPEMLSRYADSLVAPDPETGEGSLLEILRELAEALPARAVLIPTTDAFVLFMARHRLELEKRYDFVVPDYETVMTLVNKRLQYEFAAKLGIPTPETFYPSDLPIEEIAKEVRYPCILKPYFSHLWQKFLDARHERRWGKVALVRSPQELVTTYHSVRESGLDFVVQEVVAGGPLQLYDVLAYLNRSSEPLAVFTKHKTRIYPLDFGVSSIAVGEWVEPVATMGLNLVRNLKFRGVVSVEFKRDERDGELKLIEVNPRSILTTYLAVRSGVDIPHLNYMDAKGEAVEATTSFHPGVKWISLEKDWKAFLDYRRTGSLDLASWMRSWRGERCFAILAWDDPLPACVGFVQFVLQELRQARLNLSR